MIIASQFLTAAVLVSQFLSSVDNSPELRARMEAADGNVAQIVAIANSEGFNMTPEQFLVGHATVEHATTVAAQSGQAGRDWFAAYAEAEGATSANASKGQVDYAWFAAYAEAEAAKAEAAPSAVDTAYFAAWAQAEVGYAYVEAWAQAEVGYAYVAAWAETE
jgi:hypothetical protein